MSRARMTILLAGLIGLGAGALAFYWTGGPARNASAQACSASRATAAKLKPLAHGELAAFQVTVNPILPPNLAFKAPDGRQLTLADFRGRAVLLNLWATWCAPCRQEMPALDRLQQTLGGERFEVVAVNIDTRNTERATTWLKETGIAKLANYNDHSARIFQDLKVAGRAFGMPTTLLIDANGCELGYLAGPAEWASEDALRLVRTALGS